MDCLALPLDTDAEDDWVCPECAVIPQDTGRAVHMDQENSVAAVEEEITDGELNDLLAEGDDAAPVSSRLRPSTLNRPHGFTARRHSRRIRSRTGTSYGVIPSSQPHTSTVNGFHSIFVIVHC